jgi:heterodisulfide reductase subunit C2
VAALSGTPNKESTNRNPSWALAQEVISRGTKIYPSEELETLYKCIQCGTCTGSCPSGRRTALRVRTIIRQVQMGRKEEVLENPALWSCTTCYTCQERCPRDVKVTDVVKIVRNIVFEEGRAKDRHLAVANNFIKTGHTIPFTEDGKRVRSKLGLDPIPPTSLRFSDALLEIQEIMKIDGFHSKVMRDKK